MPQTHPLVVEPQRGLPQITIITPCSNQAHGLRETIESVIDQGYPNRQHIVVVSRKSRDESYEIAKSFSDSVTVFLDDGCGPEQAINSVLNHVTGEVIAIIGSGDTYLPGALKHVGTWFGQDGGRGISHRGTEVTE